MNDEPRPGTTAAVDQRVTRIESKVDILEQRVARVESTQEHTRELMNLHFTAIQASQNALMVKLEAIEARWALASVEGAKMMSDPSSTSAGKQIIERIEVVEGVANSALKEATEGQRRWAFAAGAVAVAVTLINLLGPVVFRLLTTP